MTNAQKRQVERYMHDVAHEHRDRFTGEVNATLLAEDAALFSPIPADTLPGWDGETPEVYFEIAARVAQAT